MVPPFFQQGAQNGPDFLKGPLNTAFGAARFAGDFGDLMTLDAQLNHLTLLGGESLQGLIDCELQSRVGHIIFAGPVRQETVGRTVGDGQAHVAFAGTMESFFGADLVQGYDQEQPPQLFTGGNVVVPLQHAAEKASEYRLDDVFRFDPTRQLRRAIGPNQSPQAMHIADIELGGRVLIAAPKAAQQRMIGRLR